MNVIAKISCYLERGVVTLKLRKEYLNSVTHTTSVLLRIKYWTVWCIERYSMSTYTGVTNCQKIVRFFWPTLYIVHISDFSFCHCVLHSTIQPVGCKSFNNWLTSLLASCKCKQMGLGIVELCTCIILHMIGNLPHNWIKFPKSSNLCIIYLFQNGILLYNIINHNHNQKPTVLLYKRIWTT